MITGKSIVKRSVYKPKLHWLCERYGIDASLLSNLQILLDQSRHDSEGTSGRWVDISGNGNDLVQGTAGSQPTLFPTYRDFDGNDFIQQKEIDSEQGALSYTTEGADSTFTDASQVFTTWQTASGTAAYRIVVHNDDATISYGYLGAAVSATEVKVYNSAALSTSGWLGTAIAGKTPSTYEIYKVIGSSNLTVDFTQIFVFKPDDGIPGSNEFLMCIGDAGATGVGSIDLYYKAVIVQKARRVGSVERAVVCNNPLSDGAQSNFTVLAIVIDTTTGTGAIYVNGVAQTLTENTMDAIATADQYSPLRLGARNQNGAITSYFNGKIAIYMCFDTALTATQILNIYNSDAVQAAVR